MVVPCDPQVPREVTERLPTVMEPAAGSEEETVAEVGSVVEECKYLLPDNLALHKNVALLISTTSKYSTLII